jgi:hypothetical protein
MSTELFKQIQEMLDKNGFKYDIVEDQINSTRIIFFKVPAGRKEYECKVYENDIELKELLSGEIGKYNFIEGYQAIWSCEKGNIECEIAPASSGPDPTPQYVIELELRVLNTYMPEYMRIPLPENLGEIRNMEFEPIENMKVSIGLSSQEFAILSGCRWVDYSLGIETEKEKWTLKLSNIEVKTHEEAQKLLIKVANSLFFQIDLLTDMSLTLVPEKENCYSRKIRASMNKSSAKSKTELMAPKFEYDDEAMSFYWYAKNADGMPLLQFLAYYQVIEYYFPAYIEPKAKSQIEKIITNPNFKISIDADIRKLLNVIREFANHKAFKDEKEILEYIVKSCISGKELKDFISLETERTKFYSSINDEISKEIISLNSDIEEILLAQVARRIYDIRCQIVHSKEGYENRLNPYSPKIKRLDYDLELIEFISKRILIAHSKPLNIHEFEVSRVSPNKKNILK